MNFELKLKKMESRNLKFSVLNLSRRIGNGKLTSFTVLIKVKGVTKKWFTLCLCAFVPVCLVFYEPVAYSVSRHVSVLKVEGVINPMVARYVERGIRQAEDTVAECLVIEMDTPGGLDTAMRAIISKMFESRVPVVVYVSPSGSRAASAGTFIGMAADVLAMAPATNMGAAHPVALGQKMPKDISEKATNDAAAYIRSIARKRGRNGQWAELAVKKSLSISETEAVQKNVADFVAQDLNALLERLHGRKVKGKFGEKTLNTKNAALQRIPMTFQEKFLHEISDPNIAYILLTMAISLIIWGLLSPGTFVPETVGAICLLLSFFALGNLSVNLVGVLLILFAILLFIAEVKIQSFGALGVGGIVSLILGAMMLYTGPTPYGSIRVSWSVIFASAAFTVALFLWGFRVAFSSLHSKVQSGREGLVGSSGVAKTDLSPFGIVLLSGEDWNAETEEGVISRGEKVLVTGMEGLKVKVKKWSAP